MVLKSFGTSRSLTTRMDFDDAGHKQGRSDDRLVVGRHDGKRYRSYIDYDIPDGFWDDVQVVTAAVLRLTVADNAGSIVSTGPSGAVRIRRNTEHFSEGTNGWKDGDYEPLRVASDPSWRGDVVTGDPNEVLDVDILNLVRQWAPKKVNFRLPSGAASGLDRAMHGVALTTPGNEGTSSEACEFWSNEAGTSGNRPVIVLTYEEVNRKPDTVMVSPSGAVESDFDISGTFVDPNTGDFVTRVHVQVFKPGGTTPVWQETVANPELDDDKDWHIVPPPVGTLAKGDYEIRAMVWDQKDVPSDWSPRKAFDITALVPSITAADIGPLPTLDGMRFEAPWDVAASALPAKQVDIQLQYVGRDWSAPLWNESYAPTQAERDGGGVLTGYRGASLGAGTYEWRVRVTDALDAMSAWSVASLVLTVGQPPDEGQSVFTTGWNRRSVNQRILIKAMGANRGPGRILAVIENASNIGCSWYASAPGELYFTLPSHHPQVSLIEPMVTHYEYQQYRQGRWKPLAYGLMRDFDATADETVFYGLDYLGLLSRSIENAHQPWGKKENPHKNLDSSKLSSVNGSRYFKKTIRHIITDQLKRAQKQDPDSPVRFIEVGDISKAFKTEVTIYASYAERLGFIRGLIESHKGAVRPDGGERRSRLRVRWNAGADHFQFDADDDQGKDRPNIRLEYGGILQGYQVVALDDFATRVYGVGTEPNASRPYFKNVSAPGVDPKKWGAIGATVYHEDVTDDRDLERRARAMAIQRSRVGRRVALGLRVAGLDPFDGWDILDAMPVVINDGVVDTSLYGSGYWVIWGVEFRVFPDGHDELSLVVRPKGDRTSIDPDLIPSDPVHFKTDWKWGPGPPPVTP